MIKSSFVAAATIAASCGCAFATDLLFTNAAGNGYWDEQDVNWINRETGNPSAYISEANAYIYEGEWGSADDLTVTFRKLKRNESGSDAVYQFALGNTYISNDTAKVTLKADGNNFYNYHTGSGNHGVSGGVTKDGRGVLEMRYHNQFNGDFVCNGGTVATYYGSNHPADYRTVLGSNIAKRNVIFNPGTRLEIYESYPFGGPTSGDSVTYKFNQATVKVEKNGGAVAFGRTTFTDSVFEKFGVSKIFFANDLTFTGNGGKPVTFDFDSSLGGCWMVFGKNNAFINLKVDDITGNDEPDLIFNTRLASDFFQHGNGNRYFPKAFRKTGKGTVKFTAVGSLCTNVMWFSEGKAIFDHAGGWYANLNSVFGLIDSGDGQHARLVVDNGAVLELPKNATAGEINNPMSWELSISNATLRLADGTYQQFGALRLHNATLDWVNAYQNSWINYDFIGCSTELVLSGDTPYDFQPKGKHPANAFADNCTFRLGFTKASAKDDHPIAAAGTDPGAAAWQKYAKFTNMWHVVDFKVEDITKDDGIDATMGWTIKDMVNMSYITIDSGETWSGNPWKNYRFHGGIRKLGAGTFRTQGQNTYTHSTEVAEGALIVDGSIASSSGVTVDAGAFLGGTGTTCPVTVKPDGGFIVDTGKATETVLKIPSLTTEGAVMVKVTDVGKHGYRDFFKKLLQLTNKPAQVDLSQWKVVNAEGRYCAINPEYDAETGVISLIKQGMMILVQ